MSEVVAKASDAQVMGDLDATVAGAKAQGADTARLGITGFGWGGRTTLMYAAHNPAVKAAVAWYGPVARSYHPGDKTALEVAGKKIEDVRLATAGAGAAGIAARDGKELLLADDAEGRRIASQLNGHDVMFMASHGVTVVGQSVAWAFDDLYYLERACMHQVLAVQAAGGRALRRVPDELCAATAAQIAGERQQSDMFMASVKRMLDRDEPGWR